MPLLFLLCVFFISYAFNAPLAQAQVPTEHPELIEGPWETATASGIDGISFETLTSSSGPAGDEQFHWQTISIRVYHREGGKEAWGYFATKEKASPQSYLLEDDHSLTFFDGERLRIHFVDVTDLKPFDLDVTFSATAQAWTGTWSHSGRSSRVVLKRPQANPDVAASPFVGDWLGESVGTSSDTGSLHIRQSADGMLTAWLDRASSGFDLRNQSMNHERRNGEFLRVSTVAPTGIFLDRAEVGGMGFSFRGTLSEDRKVLSGTWTRMGGGGLNAPNIFQKAPGLLENQKSSMDQYMDVPRLRGATRPESAQLFRICCRLCLTVATALMDGRRYIPGPWLSAERSVGWAVMNFYYDRYSSVRRDRVQFVA